MAQMHLSGNRHAWCFKMTASMVTTVEGLSKLSQIKKGKENPNEAFDRQLKTGLIANPCEACHTKKNKGVFFQNHPVVTALSSTKKRSRHVSHIVENCDSQNSQVFVHKKNHAHTKTDHAEDAHVQLYKSQTTMHTQKKSRRNAWRQANTPILGSIFINDAPCHHSRSQICHFDRATFTRGHCNLTLWCHRTCPARTACRGMNLPPSDSTSATHSLPPTRSHRNFNESSFRSFPLFELFVDLTWTASVRRTVSYPCASYVSSSSIGELEEFFSQRRIVIW